MGFRVYIAGITRGANSYPDVPNHSASTGNQCAYRRARDRLAATGLSNATKRDPQSFSVGRHSGNGWRHPPWNLRASLRVGPFKTTPATPAGTRASRIGNASKAGIQL